MTDTRTIEKTVRNGPALGLAIVLVGCFLACIVYDSYSLCISVKDEVTKTSSSPVLLNISFLLY